MIWSIINSDSDGKQFIVIACGGGKMGTPSGDSYIAFSLGAKNTTIK